jgi:hypothetical protein
MVRCALSLSCMRGNMVRCSLAAGGRFLGCAGSATACDARTIIKDPTPYLRVRHTGVPLSCPGFDGLVCARHLVGGDTDPSPPRKARGARLGGDIRR